MKTYDFIFFDKGLELQLKHQFKSENDNTAMDYIDENYPTVPGWLSNPVSERCVDETVDNAEWQDTAQGKGVLKTFQIND